MSALRQIQAASVDEYGETRPNGPPSYEDSVIIPMERLDGLSEFLAQIEDIRDLLKGMNTDVESVKKKHSDILSSPNTDDPKRKELDELMARLKRTSTVIRSKLKDIERQIQKDEQNDDESDARLRIKKTQHAALLRLFIDSMNEYQLAQTDYRDRCKGRIKRQLEITGTYLEDEEVENIMEQGDWSVFTQGIISETAQAKQMLADIEARHNDIIQLEKSIRELHEMFVEMATLVESQGEQIDRIENHVSSAKEHVEKAQEETKAAVAYQSAARRKKFYIVGIILLVILVLALIIYFTA
jgi:syntaxin 1A